MIRNNKTKSKNTETILEASFPRKFNLQIYQAYVNLSNLD